MISRDPLTRQRKLEQLYGALEASDYVTAYKLSLRKDIAAWDVTKALRAHALERLGRADEALELARDVKRRVPADSSVLQPLRLVFTLSGNAHEAVELYESANKQAADDEDVARELYSLYIGEQLFTKQQRLAMSMSRTFPGKKYEFWTALAIVLSVRNGGNERILQIAERILLPILQDEQRTHSESEVMLLVDVLEAQGKFDAAVDLIASCERTSAERTPIVDEDSLTVSVGDNMMLAPSDSMLKKAELLLRADKAGAAEEIYSALLEKDPGNWLHYEGLLNCCARGAAAAPLLARVRGLRDGRNRAPPLFELKLLASAGADEGGRCRAPFDASRDFSACMADGVASYVDAFGHKACAFADLREFVLGLPSAEPLAPQLAARRRDCTAALLSFADASAASEEQTKAHADALHRLDCVLRLERLCGPPAARAAPEELRAEVEGLLDVYERTLPLNRGATGGQREVQHGDALLLLLAERLSIAARAHPRDAAYAFAEPLALQLLEHGIRKSPYNYRLKLQVLRLWGELGAPQAAVEHFNALQVKQIQADTLSFLVLPLCQNLALFREAFQQCRAVVSMHKFAQRDAADCAGRAAAFGNYPQAAEMVEFQGKHMDRSLQLALCKAELAQLTLLLEHHGLEEARAYLVARAEGKVPEAFRDNALDEDAVASGDAAAIAALDALCCNCDLSVLDGCARPEERVHPDAERLRAKMVALLREKLQLLGALKALVVAESAAGGAAAVAALRDTLALHGVLPEGLAGALEGVSISGGAPGDAKGACWRTALAALEALGAVLDAARAPEEKGAAIGSLREALAGAPDAIGLAAEAQAAGGQGVEWEHRVSRFVGLALPVALLCLLKALGAERVELSRKKKKKGKKGKKAAAPAASESPLAEPLRQCAEALMALLKTLRDRLRPLADTSMSDVGQRLAAIGAVQVPALAAVSSDVMAKVVEGRTMTCERLLSCVRDKMNCLQAMGLN